MGTSRLAVLVQLPAATLLNQVYGALRDEGLYATATKFNEEAVLISSHDEAVELAFKYGRAYLDETLEIPTTATAAEYKKMAEQGCGEEKV
jgi:hypothetical protein